MPNPRRILLVEDDPVINRTVADRLTGEGYDVVRAYDGPGAVAACEESRPDAVVLDVMLPGIDGWSVLEDLHALGDPVPVVVCSAKKDAEDMERARQLGASGYVVKPFDIDRLIDAVLEATGRSRRMQTGRASDFAIERPDLA